MSRRIRVYCPHLDKDSVQGVQRVQVVGPEFHHARNVLRVHPGDEVELFDGQGRYAAGTVMEMAKDRLVVSAGSVVVEPAGEFGITLAMAIPKLSSSGQECLVFHGTEIGIDRFWPIVSDRSSVRRVGLDKWRRWSIEACKQCGRNRLPQFAEPVRLGAALAGLDEFDLRIYGSASGSSGCDFSQVAGNWQNAIVFVGPEGGFTDDEIRELEDHAVGPIRIGRNVLRIETAAVALASALIGRRAVGFAHRQ